MTEFTQKGLNIAPALRMWTDLAFLVRLSVDKVRKTCNTYARTASAAADVVLRYGSTSVPVLRWSGCRQQSK